MRTVSLPGLGGSLYERVHSNNARYRLELPIAAPPPRRVKIGRRRAEQGLGVPSVAAELGLGAPSVAAELGLGVPSVAADLGLGVPRVAAELGLGAPRVAAELGLGVPRVAAELGLGVPRPAIGYLVRREAAWTAA